MISSDDPYASGSEADAGEWLAIDDNVRQTQLTTDNANLIPKKEPHWLNEFDFGTKGLMNDAVMSRHVPSGDDDVFVVGSEGYDVHLVLCGEACEQALKACSDHAAYLVRIAISFDIFEERVLGVHDFDSRAKHSTKGFGDSCRLFLSKEAVVSRADM